MGDATGPSPRLVALGYISRAHGIGGEVRIERFNAASDVLSSVTEIGLRLRGATDVRFFGLTRVAPAGKAVLAKLANVDSKQAADALRGHEVLVPRSALPEPDADEVYLVDLVGLGVEEDGLVLGTVASAVSHPAADCVRVQTARGIVELPLVPPYVVEVDLRRRVIVVANSADFEPEPGSGTEPRLLEPESPSDAEPGEP